MLQRACVSMTHLRIGDNLGRRSGQSSELGGADLPLSEL